VFVVDFPQLKKHVGLGPFLDTQSFLSAQVAKRKKTASAHPPNLVWVGWCVGSFGVFVCHVHNFMGAVFVAGHVFLLLGVAFCVTTIPPWFLTAWMGLFCHPIFLGRSCKKNNFALPRQSMPLAWIGLF